MNFKLLAIRPLDKCDEKFLKNLQKNRIYKMYKDFVFYSNGIRLDDYTSSEENYSAVNKIEYQSSLPDAFFGTIISVSAIVGKNGSGKSTLVNLFVASLNQMSVILQRKGKLPTTADLISTSDDKESEIHCEFYYQLNNEYYVIKVEDNEFSFQTLEGDLDFDFEKFFYSNVINYSIYGFNSWELGVWIDKLFHKNDSYQIPIVINPKRESKEEGKAGIIDINNENYLLQQRLLSVILTNHEFEITENLKVDSIKLDIKPAQPFFVYSNDAQQKGKEYNDENEIKQNFYKVLRSGLGLSFRSSNSPRPSGLYFDLDKALIEFKERFNIGDISLPKDFEYKLDNYILYKIVSVCEKYIGYNDFTEVNGNEKYKRYNLKIDSFIDKMEGSHSHIVLKLKQVINFIKNYKNIWEEFLKGSPPNKISVQELSVKLNAISDFETPLIELLPPPIFSTRLISKFNIDLLDSISSGEMQLIQSTTSIIYHLNNINSVEKDGILIKYPYVNLILDEIELYFHPEYQRKFVKRLLDDIRKAQLEHIRGINILIISHSPFIISDIPSQNVLFLEVNDAKQAIPKKYESDNSFAENIHEILSNGFFLNSTIGDFAKSKIDQFLEFEISPEDTLVRQDYRNQRENLVKFINLIGENYVKKILENHLDLLDRKYLGDSYRIEKIDEEIERLQLEKKRIKDAEN